MSHLLRYYTAQRYHYTNDSGVECMIMAETKHRARRRLRELGVEPKREYTLVATGFTAVMWDAFTHPGQWLADMEVK